MRTLCNQEQIAVSGGNFNISVTGRVPDHLKDWVETMMTNVKNGVIKEPYTFILYLRQASFYGINFAEIKLDKLVYDQV